MGGNGLPEMRGSSGTMGALSQCYPWEHCSLPLGALFLKELQKFYKYR